MVNGANKRIRVCTRCIRSNKITKAAHKCAGDVKELVTAAGAAKAIGPYSPALKVGNLLFLSGSIPLDPVSGQLVEGGIRSRPRA